MQLSHDASNLAYGSPSAVATDVLDCVPPVMWFIRCRMRSHRKGLSLPQFQALVRVDQQPSTCMSLVAEHLGSSLSTTSRIVGGLVSQGLLTRTACSDDRRQFALDITPRGRAVLDSAYQGARTDLESKFSQMSGPDRNRLAGAMDVLKGIFGSLGLRDRIGEPLPPSSPPIGLRAIVQNRKSSSPPSSVKRHSRKG